MSDGNKIKDTADAITGLVKAVPIYQDAIQPTAQEVGKALQTVAKTVNMALAPVSALVWGYDQVKEFVSTKVTTRLKNVPPENIITPKLNVAGPTLEALRYTGYESELSDLYANLLAASMDSSTAHGAHPAFVEIIKQLTPDEAKLVALFADENRPLPLLDLFWEYNNSNEAGERAAGAIIKSFSHLGREANCEFEHMTPTYIDNLCRLGLAEIPVMGYYTSEGVYDALDSDTYIKRKIDEINNMGDRHHVIIHKYLRITELGKQFIRTCVIKEFICTCVIQEV